MEEAVKRVVNNNESIRSVATATGIYYVTLSRYVKQIRRKMVETGNQVSLNSVGYTKRNVFSQEKSEALVAYLKHAAKIYFGLSPRDVRVLAYECAVAFEIAVPESWTRNQCAGEDWLTIFLKRNPTLSIRTPEPTSLQRACGFNKASVSLFFDKLAQVRDRYKFDATTIWNLDETGVTTVQKIGKVIAEKGTKQVGGITSSERGVLVTVCVAVGASGTFIPPMFLFPRKKFHDHFIRDGLPGCIGRANGSGWMSADDFFCFMEHFVKCVRPSKQKPVLLLLDNHESHLAVRTLNFAKENGVVMLSFPPHCSHRLQPLDRTVYGPFKKYLSNTQASWLRSNPGKSMTIYDVPSIVRDALPLALNPLNVIKGFQVTGIEPYNKEIFSDCDFLPSSVTDHPLSDPKEGNTLVSSGENTQLSDDVNNKVATSELQSSHIEPSSPDEGILNVPLPSIPGNLGESLPSCSKGVTTALKFSPEFVKPFPKSARKDKPSRGRKKRKSAILTDTPEKEALEEEQNKRKKITKDPVIKKKREGAKKKVCIESSEEEDEGEYFCLVCCDNYNHSKPGENWLMCRKCKLWSHEQCTEGELPYICHNCNSDDDDE